MSELLDAVLADPSDDELRRVYADRLCELGDPRGEFIQLQYVRVAGALTDEGVARERELLERHATDWLGPLIAVVSEFEFARGFLVSAIVPRHRRTYNVERVAGHPLWTTVERFEGPSEIYLDPVMRSLREIVTDGGPGLRELCAGPVMRPLRRLRCRIVTTDMIEDIGNGSALPDLVELELPLDDPRDHASERRPLVILKGFLEHPLARRLQRLVLNPGWPRPLVADVLVALEHRPGVPVCEVTGDAWGLRWTLALDGDRYRRIHVRLAKLDPFYCSRLVEQLGTLDRACHVAVELDTADDTLVPEVARTGERFAGFHVIRR